jgi:hypothetical protein
LNFSGKTCPGELKKLQSAEPAEYCKLVRINSEGGK